jgi:dienelactone hydrolase
MQRPARFVSLAAAALAGALLAACSSPPLVPYTEDTPPLVLVPAGEAAVQDKRGRFREIYCAVLESHGRELPDHRPCDDALTRVGAEPAGTGRPVELGPSKRGLVVGVVPGIGFDCVAQWMAPAGGVKEHLLRQGYDLLTIKVDALSGTARNARQIRDAVMAMETGQGAPRLVLVGYSKGAPDVLDAVVTYPEIRSRVAAVVSAAGAVGGSPLANDAEQYQADILQHFPGAKCDAGDGGAVASLRPAVRRAWLAEHPLPAGVRYYSLVTFPRPGRMSSILTGSYDKLARIDPRNDSQMIFYDQVIPRSTLMGYVNADHWALALPIARTHDTVGKLLVTQNAYPREALTEAMLRFIEEDLASGP